MNITPFLKEKMLKTIKSMKEGNKTFMIVEGMDFFISTEEEQENAMVLGAEEVGGKKYFLCQEEE